MRQLRFARPGPDQDHVVVETGDGDEQFVLTVDAALRDAVRSDLPRLHAEPEPPPGLGPREIQMRVRGGEAPEQVAADSGMSLERVMRFAGPVLDERTRIADEARRGRARRSSAQGAESTVVAFGEAVDARFTAHGVDVAKIAWDARRRDDGNWVISARWVGGRAERLAEWLFQLSGRMVSPLDETAADLLSDRPIRAVVADLPARTISASAPPLVPGVVAFPAMPDARTGPLPAVEDVFDQEAPDPDAPRVEPAAASSEAGEFDVQALPLGLDDPAPQHAAPHRANLGVGRREESEEQRAARVHIPSWDDIMLGVRRKTD